VEDAVLGGWANGLGAGAPAGTVDARADPDGANPRGTLRHQLYAPSTIFRGRVTCLRVSGFTATVGAVGQRTTDGTEPDPGGPPNASSLVTVVDGGPHATDRTGVTTSSSTAPPNCAAGPTQTFGATIPAVNVYDAR
jgi:hypothetical protein